MAVVPNPDEMPKRTFGKSTSGPTATPQSNAPSGNGHRYDAAEKIWDGDPMTMSLWFVQTIEDLQDADPKFNRLVESATALTPRAVGSWLVAARPGSRARPRPRTSA